MNKISKRTRGEFEDYFVARSVVREISRYFENYDIPETPVPVAQQTSSVRRNLIRSYYASINWDEPKDISKVILVYRDFLNKISDETQFGYGKDDSKRIVDALNKYLQKDGFYFTGQEIEVIGQIVPIGILETQSVLDTTHFQEYIERIRTSIETDPSLAIGSTKELVESTLKTVLLELSIVYNKNADIPSLLKLVQKALKLVPDEVDEKVKGAEHIKVLMSNLGQVVVKIAELRNLYGTGHGRVGSKSVLKPRHARLAASAGIALSTFLIENYKEQNPTK